MALVAFVSIPVAAGGGRYSFSEKGSDEEWFTSDDVPLFGLLHPTLQHGLNFMRTLRRDVQFLEPAEAQRGSKR